MLIHIYNKRPNYGVVRWSNFMNFIKKMLTFLFVVICIVSFGLFVYPGMYKYDKLNQKYPVKINRITGTTEVLTLKGWQDAESYDAAKNEMLEYKQDISKQMMEQNEDIKRAVLDEIKDQLEQVKNDVIKETMGMESVVNPAPNGTFSKGDTTKKVQEVMGVADSVTEVGPYETWFYGLSMVKFKDGKVTGWENRGDLSIE